MSYIDPNLMDGEQVLYLARPHRITLLVPALAAALAAAAGAALLIYVRPWLGGIVALAGVSYFVPHYLQYIGQEFGVTNRRLFIKGGVVSRQSLETLLLRVGTIEVDQDFLGRVLGYGDVVVKASGGTQELLEKMDDPLRFRQRVYEQILATPR